MANASFNTVNVNNISLPTYGTNIGEIIAKTLGFQRNHSTLTTYIPLDTLMVNKAIISSTAIEAPECSTALLTFLNDVDGNNEPRRQTIAFTDALATKINTTELFTLDEKLKLEVLQTPDANSLSLGSAILSTSPFHKLTIQTTVANLNSSFELITSNNSNVQNNFLFNQNGDLSGTKSITQVSTVSSDAVVNNFKKSLIRITNTDGLVGGGTASEVFDTTSGRGVIINPNCTTGFLNPNVAANDTLICSRSPQSNSSILLSVWSTLNLGVKVNVTDNLTGSITLQAGGAILRTETSTSFSRISCNRSILMDGTNNADRNITNVNALYLNQLFFNGSEVDLNQTRTQILFSHSTNESTFESGMGRILIKPSSAAGGVGIYGGGNPIVQAQDNVIMGYSTPTGMHVLTLVPWSNTSTGVRLTQSFAELYKPKVMDNLTFADGTVQSTAGGVNYSSQITTLEGKTKLIFSPGPDKITFNFQTGRIHVLPNSVIEGDEKNPIILAGDNAIIGFSTNLGGPNVLALAAKTNTSTGIRLTPSFAELYKPKVMDNLTFADGTVQSTAGGGGVDYSSQITTLQTKTRILFSHSSKESSFEYELGRMQFLPYTTGGAGNKNPIVVAGDNALIGYNAPGGGSHVLALVAWSTTASGIRVRETEVQLYLPKVMDTLTFPDATVQSTAFTQAKNEKLTGIGTFITATKIASFYLTSGALVNCASMSLTPGTWIIASQAVIGIAGASSVSATFGSFEAGISITNNTMNPFERRALLNGGNAVYTNHAHLTASGCYTVQVVSTQMLYLNLRCAFPTATTWAYSMENTLLTATRIA